MTQESKLTQDQRIVKWNEERQLIKTPDELDMCNNMSFIIEEVIEGLTDIKSDEAREYSQLLVKIIAGGYLPHCMAILESEVGNIPDIKTNHSKESVENFVDALGDIKVFATGAIRKAGYDPDSVMEEVLKEIESRVGEVKNGKFIKDKSPEAQANWHKADFDNAFIK